jgi:hypothetical protein
MSVTSTFVTSKDVLESVWPGSSMKPVMIFSTCQLQAASFMKGNTKGEGYYFVFGSSQVQIMGRRLDVLDEWSSSKLAICMNYFCFVVCWRERKERWLLV